MAKANRWGVDKRAKENTPLHREADRMARTDWGSLTKELPISTLDDTITAIRPGMPYDQLLSYARANTLDAAPGLIRKRFILVDDDETIMYDRFLQLVSERGIDSHFIRKIMYFVWAYRDERIRGFICERVADRRGKWRRTQLVNKANADFFEEWLVPGSARKARSNIEFFLKEAGIFDPTERSIHLELHDGWLTEAAVVAAQHERDPVTRRKLLNDPRDFLIQRRWTGLVNATDDELRGAELPETDDPSPLEDDSITVTPATMSSGRSWDRDRPRHTGRRSTTALIDLVARERASKAHHMLEKLTAEAARSLKYDPKYNEHIDMYFDTPHGTVLAEIKSANGRNYHSQIRKGVSQLFEYRFVYGAVVGTSPTLVLVMETHPQRSKDWLADYLDSLDITLAWKDPASSKLVSTRSIPPALKGIVHSPEE